MINFLMWVCDVCRKKTGSLHNPPPRLFYPPPMIGRMLFSCLWSAVLWPSVIGYSLGEGGEAWTITG